MAFAQYTLPNLFAMAGSHLPLNSCFHKTLSSQEAKSGNSSVEIPTVILNAWCSICWFPRLLSSLDSEFLGGRAACPLQTYIITHKCPEDNTNSDSIILNLHWLLFSFFFLVSFFNSTKCAESILFLHESEWSICSKLSIPNKSIIEIS